MKTQHGKARACWRLVVSLPLFTLALAGVAETLPPLVDDFSDPQANSLGIARQYFDDRSTGGGSSLFPQVDNGVLSVAGELLPARGQPAWAACALLLDARGMPRDASAYEGVRLRVRIREGSLSVSANSTEIDNFDYHAAPVRARADGEFHEVRIPFASMRRAWSPQMPLDTATLNGLSIVAFGLQRGFVDYAVDEVGFY